jgi:hypothetical protein
MDDIKRRMAMRGAMAKIKKVWRNRDITKAARNH